MQAFRTNDFHNKYKMIQHCKITFTTVKLVIIYSFGNFIKMRYH